MIHQPKCCRSGEALEENFVLKTEPLLEQPWQDITGPVFKHFADGSLWFCRWPSRDLVHICVFISLAIIHIPSSLVGPTNPPWFFTSLLLTAICKASSDSHFAFLHFLRLQARRRNLWCVNCGFVGLSYYGL